MERLKSSAMDSSPAARRSTVNFPCHVPVLIHVHLGCTLRCLSAARCHSRHSPRLANPAYCVIGECHLIVKQAEPNLTNRQYSGGIHDWSSPDDKSSAEVHQGLLALATDRARSTKHIAIAFLRPTCAAQSGFIAARARWKASRSCSNQYNGTDCP